MRILICDDELEYLNTLRIHIEEYMRNYHILYTITALTDPTKAMTEERMYDLAFLDIQMVGLNGIVLAKQLRQRNRKIALFFITNYDEYQDDAMDLQAFRFFEKPFNISRLYAGLDKAMEYIDGAYVDIFLTDNSIQRRIIVDDILYVTREGRKVVLITEQQAYAISEKFDDFCAKFFFSSLIRIR